MRAFLLGVILVPLCLASTGCGQGDGQKKADLDKDKTYEIKGKVVSLDPGKKSVALDHEDIPGLMKGMKMAFAVEDAKVLEGLQAGDQVQGKLKAKAGSYVILDLHKK